MLVDRCEDGTVLNALQNKCCGLENANDWDANTNFTCHNTGSQLSCGVPDSCCKEMYEVRSLIVLYNFTARCTLVQSAVLLSVTFVIPD